MKVLKISLLILGIAISFSGICQKNQVKSIPVQYQKTIKNNLLAWINSNSSFDSDSFLRVDKIAFNDNCYHDPEKVGDFLNIYKNIVTWSFDKKRFIDIYSYALNLKLRKGKVVYEKGGEDHQAINLYDKNKKKWHRVFLCGGSTRIQEAAWFSKNIFIIVGVEQSEAADKSTPLIIIGDCTEKYCFRYS